jgi:DNA-directed RNA polymerase sigma subunit (sigma70/sigma32)
MNLIEEEKFEQLDSFISQLPEKLKTALTLYYGLNDGNHKSFNQVSKLINKSPESARQQTKTAERLLRGKYSRIGIQ